MTQVIEFYRQNLQLARERGDRGGEIDALGSLGRAWLALGDRVEAVACFEEALRLCRETGDQERERWIDPQLQEALHPEIPSAKKSPRRRPGSRSSRKTK